MCIRDRYKAIRTKSKLKIEYNNEISVIIPTMLIFEEEILLVGFLENEDGLMQENEEKSYKINKIKRMKTLGRHNIKFNEKKLILNKKGLWVLFLFKINKIENFTKK